jgi:hypothetical protein
VSPSPLASFKVALAVGAALWCTQSCLAPGSLENEEKYRVRFDAAEGDPTQGRDAGKPAPSGCAAACDTFRNTCAMSDCHSAGNPVVNLDLESPGLVARLSGAPAQSVPCFDQTLLVPGNPSKSIIYTKLLAKPGCGLRMPLTGALSDPDIDCVRRWVLAPACNGDSMPDASMGMGGATGSDGGKTSADGGAAGTGGKMNGAGGSTSSGGDMSGMGGTMSGGAGGRGGRGGRAGATSTGGKATGGNAGTPADAGKGSTIFFEAESGDLTAPMVTAMNSGASNSVYITAPGAAMNSNPAMSGMGIATFMFDVPTAGTYTAFGRVQSTASSSDSFWVKMDAGAWIQWSGLMAMSTWVWDSVTDASKGNAVVTFMLSAGNHTLLVAYRDPDTWLDKVALSSEPGFKPTGLGQ